MGARSTEPGVGCSFRMTNRRVDAQPGIVVVESGSILLLINCMHSERRASTRAATAITLHSLWMFGLLTRPALTQEQEPVTGNQVTTGERGAYSKNICLSTYLSAIYMYVCFGLGGDSSFSVPSFVHFFSPHGPPTPSCVDAALFTFP